ncbi:predicted protein [Verticillium alfalfae VaMs.102]|uniref:Predicted protein n=1 Tax=Verticillium alfalfae (strain VaMs.102 / ATCC MYA-4576 / FGSC 10136) TaxID=526221 RepID=C9SGK9_VERA1|nr:predicted protein [Verticillium alfalfae VaMs.102]EEY17526.1 predicted protein [Verticillium alfalfae VaMs.102]
MATAANDVELHQAPEPQGGALQTAKDLFSGAAGGITQGPRRPALRHSQGPPPDVDGAHVGPRGGDGHSTGTRGALAFYKGTLTPLIGIGRLRVDPGSAPSTRARRYLRRRATPATRCRCGPT